MRASILATCGLVASAAAATAANCSREFLTAATDAYVAAQARGAGTFAYVAPNVSYSEGGVQVLKSQLPAMITMLEGSNTMRFGTMDDMFRAARTPLMNWNKDTCVDDESKVGLKGSPTVVSKVFVPKPRAQKAKMVTAEGGSAALAAAAVDMLFTTYPKLATDLAG